VDEALAEALSTEFEITTSDDLSRLLTMDEEGYSLCVSYLDMFDQPFPADAANAVLSFVVHGGGLLCLHNGISLQSDDRLFHLIGGKFTGHPPQTNLEFSPHPDGFLRGMPSFTLTEEPYQFEMSGDEVIPLLTYRYKDTDFQSGWCRTEGRGRVVFLTPGHSIASFRSQAYLTMIRKSAEWAAMMINKQQFGNPEDKAPASEEPTINEKRKHYTPEFKAAALAMMEEKGAVATIKEFGISSYTLYDWKSRAEGQNYPRKQGPLTGKKRKHYTQEFKAEVIEYYQSHGARETLKKYGIVGNSLYKWLNEAGVEHVGYNHTNAIALYQEKGEEAVLEEYGVTKATLRDWLKEAGINLHTQKYSAEFKVAAVAMTEEKPLTTVAKELGIPASTLATWKMKNR
jgi:transposase-like protein